MNTGVLFWEMHDLGLTTSMRSWSEQWLHKSHNFASINWDRPLPPAVLLTLRRNLIQRGAHELAARVLVALLEEASELERGGANG